MPKTPGRTRAIPPATGGDGFLARKANMADIPDILRLVNGYAAQGIMLPRTEFEMGENIRDFMVIRSGEELAGTGALHFYTPTAGEVRSLAVSPDFQRHGAGRRLVEALEAEAEAFGLHSVFAFTYIPHFFARLGYREIERGELPLKAWKDCMRCPKFTACDEIAVIKHLAEEPMRVGDTRIRGLITSVTVPPAPTVLVPVPVKPR